MAREKRQAPDGLYYTKQEFASYFGGHAEWHAAAPTPQAAAEPPERPAGDDGVTLPPQRRTRVALNSALFQQVVTIQKDRESFQTLRATDKKHIKRWQSTTHWEQYGSQQGGTSAADTLTLPVSVSSTPLATTNGVPDAAESGPILRPSKQGQAYRCPECAALFDLATHKWGMFLEHIKREHPGVAQPKRKDPGILVNLAADGTVLNALYTRRTADC